MKSLIKSDDSDCMITSEGDSPDEKKLNTELSKKITINCCRTTPGMKMEASSDTLQGMAELEVVKPRRGSAGNNTKSFTSIVKDGTEGITTGDNNEKKRQSLDQTPAEPILGWKRSSRTNYC